MMAIYQHFSGAAAGVVVARHAHAVSACRQHGQGVSGLHIELAIAAYPIATFTHRANHVDQRPCASARADGHNLMKSLVHGWTGQIVHGGINDAKILLLAWLHEHHVRQADTSVAYQGAAGFNHELPLAITARI